MCRNDIVPSDDTRPNLATRSSDESGSPKIYVLDLPVDFADRHPLSTILYALVMTPKAATTAVNNLQRWPHIHIHVLEIKTNSTMIDEGFFKLLFWKCYTNAFLYVVFVQYRVVFFFFENTRLKLKNIVSVRAPHTYVTRL